MASTGTFRNATGAFFEGLKATFSNLGTVLPLMLFMGMVAAGGDMLIYRSLGGDLSQDQGTLIKVVLAWTGFALAQEILLGPIVSAIAIYIGRLHSAGEPVRPYAALNFALGRYGRMFVPHMIAQLSIQIGLMLLMFPGMIYVSMYAFVDSVACLEQKVWPIDQSKKLTRARRGSIVLIYLPVALLVQVVAFAELWALEQGLFMLSAVFATVALLFFIVDVAFYKLYERRTAAVVAAAVATAAPDAALPIQ